MGWSMNLGVSPQHGHRARRHQISHLQQRRGISQNNLLGQACTIRSAQPVLRISHARHRRSPCGGSVPHLLDRLTQTALTLRGYQSAQVDTPAGTLSALVWEGQGPLPPLTVVHGFASAGCHQVLFARRLKRQVQRLVLPDLPGHGFSDAPDPLTPDHVEGALEVALDELQPEPGVLLGSSFGGWAAARYAATHPDRVRGLCLVSPLGAPMTREEREPIVELLRARSVEHVRQFIERAARRPQRRHHLYAWTMRPVLAQRPLQDLVERAVGNPLLNEADLARIRVPVLVIWGSHERLFPERHLDFWRQLPDVTILRPENSAHTPSYDEPDWFCDTVTEFLERLTA